MTTEREYRRALFMCAASCQGGNSTAGAAAADILGVAFPIRMDSLAKAATADGFTVDELWPWWVKMRARAGGQLP